jgi:DNA-binding transcriptional LysR family regulator
VDVLVPLADLQAALQSFLMAYVRVQRQLFTSSLNNLWDELRNRSFDFALSLVASIPLDMEGCSFRQITLGPIASASHPLALLKRPLSLSDVRRERQIYFVGSPHIAIERVGRVFSLDVWTANDLEHIRLLIRNGFGWCFGTEEFFSEELRAGSVRMLPCSDAQLQPTRTISAVWLAERRPGPLGRELIGLVASRLSRTPPMNVRPRSDVMPAMTQPDRSSISSGGGLGQEPGGAEGRSSVQSFSKRRDRASNRT